jgi:hypothetical protein
VPFSAARGCSRSEACASCSLAQRRAACRPSARRRRTGHREARGRSMQVRPGKIAFHGATLTLVTRSVRACGVDSSACPTERPTSDIPVASSEALACRIAWRSVRELEGRQDRFRGGLVKGVRFSDPRCLPSSGASRPPPVPKHVRTVEPSSKCGVHVMRIAASRTNHLPFASNGLLRLRASGPGACALGVSTRG